MSSMWGNKIRISLFGESHGPALGVVVDGLPSGFEIDMEQITAHMRRRAPGNYAWSTPRQEGDQVEVPFWYVQRENVRNTAGRDHP